MPSDHPAVDPAALKNSAGGAAATEGIRLDHFMQRCGVVQTGGHAKIVIQDGVVAVDGEVETRRRRKLSAGSVVSYNGQSHVVGGGSEDAGEGPATD